ncbi:MAG: hypothetical protein K0S46_1354 [Moraxellaceae bacterium]|nr:hypothetical protein [Moraxellaceae bacterium]
MNTPLAGMPSAFFDNQVRPPVVIAGNRKVWDPVGMWYAARKQRGQDDRMWFGLYRQGGLGPQWHTCSHRHCDGIGAIALLLKEQRLPGVPLPQGRDATPPEWRELWRGRNAAPPTNVNQQWKWLDPSLRSCSSHSPVSMLLDTDQTLAIEEAAAAAGVSSTVWLLWTADRALRATLALPESVNGWIYPVNLRGAVRGVDEFANHCSGLVLTIDKGADAEDCKLQIRERFERHEHWRQWLLLTLGRWIGQRGVNLLYRLAEAAPGRYAGSYSNLGEWNVPGLEGISVSAPGSAAYPVAVGTVLCNGRRTLSCRLHPVIGGYTGHAIEFVKVWRELATDVRQQRRAGAA